MFFFFNDTATTEIYTLSLHDALPIWPAFNGSGHHGTGTILDDDGAPSGVGADTRPPNTFIHGRPASPTRARRASFHLADRKSTRLNSSHANISYAVFCLK